MKTDIHKILERYDKSQQYMRGKAIAVRTEKHWLLYVGRQWEATEEHEGMTDLPTMNFTTPTIDYKVASIASTKATAMFSDMNAQLTDAVDRCNQLFDISWEKAKMQRTGKKALKHAAIQGDSYLYWGEGGDTRKSPQIVHNTNMHLGDENITDIQRQPWLIIEERLAPEIVRARAKAAGLSKEEIDRITPDAETQGNLFNHAEVKDKVTSLLYMEKDPETGIVSVGKCTQSVMYEKLHPVQQSKGGELYGNGLTMYPIVPMIWKEVPDSARGISEVEQLVPNQLEANKMVARRAISAKQTAFPKLAYDDASIMNPEDIDKVGVAIALNGGNAQAINNMIAYLSPQQMSPDAKQLTDELVDRTRSLAGASDAQLGNIDLSRVSGTAAQTVRDQQQLPLNDQQEMYQDFIENVALLWFELWKVYFPLGIQMDGIEVTADELNAITPNVRVDISEDTSLSKMILAQELTNLLNNHMITFAEFAQMYPDHGSLPKGVLDNIVAQRQQLMMAGVMPTDEMGNPIDGLQVGGGVNTGGMSGGSYQSNQASLAMKPLMG